ncbi:hypothetical protein ACSRUE_27510 [Sorangium sp. KYC3313]|uniref:hypothetical protein n=1 Tax=Sorangium sp. KYC3313 TaxID=3449740 RepID=UPI003F8CB38C
MKTQFLLCAAVLSMATGCSDTEPDEPRLCLLGSAAVEGRDPSTVACPDPPVTISVAPGEVVYIRHELPEGIEPPGPLHVRISTPCGEAESFDADYATRDGTDGEKQHIAVISRVAPVGAECSLSVHATIANSSLTRATSPSADAATCAKLVCPADDAGGGTGGGGTGGGGSSGSP